MQVNSGKNQIPAGPIMIKITTSHSNIQSYLQIPNNITTTHTPTLDYININHKELYNTATSSTIDKIK